MEEEILNEPVLDKEVEDAYNSRGFWDRKLAASLLELESLKKVMEKYKDDQVEMKRQIRKVRKSSKNVLNTIKVLDIPREDLTEQIDNATIDTVIEESQSEEP